MPRLSGSSWRKPIVASAPRPGDGEQHRGHGVVTGGNQTVRTAHKYAPRGERHQLSLAESLCELGLLQQDFLQTADAEGSFRRVLDLGLKLGHEEPGNSDYQNLCARAYSGLGTSENVLGRPADAVRALQRAIDF